MGQDESRDERREFPRVKAPLYFRPASRRLPRREIVDLGHGGIRVYSDDPLSKGARLEIELFLPDNETIVCLTEVAWIKSIEGGDPANYDIGLRFLDISGEASERLLPFLETQEKP